MTSLKGKMLLAMMPRGLANKTALISISEKNNYASKIITELISSGLVKEKKQIDSRSTTTYLEITKKGLLYLSENMSGYTQEIIQTSMRQSCGIRGKNNSEWVKRALRVQSVSAMVYGANDTVVRETELRPSLTDRKQEMSQATSFGEAMLQCVEPIGQPKNSLKTETNQSPVLYSANEVSLVESSSVHLDAQYYFTNYTHLLVSCCDAFLLYHSRSNGLTINQAATNRIFSLANLIVYKLGAGPKDHSVSEPISAVVFCPSLPNFRKTVSSLLSKGAAYFGSPHPSVYILPETYDGASVLVGLIQYGNRYHDELRKKSVDKLYPGSEACDNGKTDFTYQGADYCIGIDMDMRRIVQFDEQAGQRSEIRHVLVCEEWQRPYFEKIIQNAKLEINNYHN